MPTRDKPSKSQQSTSTSSAARAPSAPSRAPTGDTVQRARQQPASLRPGEVQALQRTVGNQAVQQLIQGSAVAPGTIQRDLDLVSTWGETVGWGQDALTLNADFKKLETAVSGVRAKLTPEVEEQFGAAVTELEGYVSTLAARKKIPFKDRAVLQGEVTARIQKAEVLATSIESTKVALARTQANETFAAGAGARAMEGMPAIGKEKVAGRAAHLDQFFTAKTRREREKREREERRRTQEAAREGKQQARSEKQAKAEKGPTDEQKAEWEKQALRGRVEIECRALLQGLAARSADAELALALDAAKIAERGTALQSRLDSSEIDSLTVSLLQGWLEEVSGLQKESAKVAGQVRAKRVQTLVRTEQDRKTRGTQDEIGKLGRSKHDKTVKKRLEGEITDYRKSTRDAFTKQFDKLMGLASFETLQALLAQASAVEIETLLVTKAIPDSKIESLLASDKTKDQTVALLQKLPDADMLLTLAGLVPGADEMTKLTGTIVALGQGANVKKYLTETTPPTLVGIKGVLDVERRKRGLIDANGNLIEQTTETAVKGDGKDDELKAIGDALKVFDGKPNAVNDWGGKWGDTFSNNGGDLPGVRRGGGYKEYYVRKPAGEGGWGARRLVVSDATGFIYYTWTHYGDNGNPPFVRIR